MSRRRNPRVDAPSGLMSLLSPKSSLMNPSLEIHCHCTQLRERNKKKQKKKTRVWRKARGPSARLEKEWVVS